MSVSDNLEFCPPRISREMLNPAQNILLTLLCKKHLAAAALLLMTPLFGIAQAIDNSNAQRSIQSEKYFRINYENDFFSASDRDYTQGILLEKVHPTFHKFFLMKLLWHPAGSAVQYGIGLEQDCYTPNHIDKADIQYGDRPYAGALFVKTFQIATNAARRERVVTQISTGIIGPAAGGEGMQRTIHHWINYTQPLGWHNQIKLDAVINYQVNYEKELVRAEHHFSLSGIGILRAGTLSDKVAAGFTAMAGSFDNPFGSFENGGNRSFKWYVYDQLMGNAVAYDATLQGGVFNRASPYTIQSRGLNRLTMYNKFGIVLTFRHLYLEYYRTGLTEEFMTSLYHRTGGLQLGFGF